MPQALGVPVRCLTSASNRAAEVVHRIVHFENRDQPLQATDTDPLPASDGSGPLRAAVIDFSLPAASYATMAIREVHQHASCARSSSVAHACRQLTKIPSDSHVLTGAAVLDPASEEASSSPLPDDDPDQGSVPDES